MGEVAVDGGSVRATVRKGETIASIELVGILNEQFDHEPLDGHCGPRVVLDLGGIDSVTSFGVRAWLEFMGKLKERDTELFLANCSEAIVNQMLMIRGFTGGGHVVSFSAPYVCTACSAALDFGFVTSSLAYKDGEYEAPPDAACSTCGGNAVFDEDPESFFEFLVNQSREPMPDDVEAVLMDRWLESSSEVASSLAKDVVGNETVVRVNRALDKSVRWKRAFAGVEGPLRFDFSNTRGVTPAGCELFTKIASTATSPITTVVLDSVPIELLNCLAKTDDIGIVSVNSVALVVPCRDCDLMRPVKVTAKQVADADKKDSVPSASCRRCGQPIDIVLPKGSHKILRESGSSGRGGAMKIYIGAGIALAAIAVVLVLLLT